MSDYSPFEENINVKSHITGFILAIFGLILLIIKSMDGYDLKGSISLIIFGTSMIILYYSSAKYHNTSDEKLRFKRKIFDHAAIYVLIAGTYSPYALVALKGSLGWMIFSIGWGFALLGICLKVFFTGRFKLISTLLYVFMGWMIVFFIKPLTQVISEEGFFWLLMGGISYTIGAVIYSIKKIKLNHAIFHIFVLVGSICHFISIYFYM